MRWSRCDRTRAPSRCRGPVITHPSSSAVMSAPIAARPSAIAAMRSDSLTRSSAAPVMREVPGSCVAATAKTGSSSIVSAAMAPLIVRGRKFGAVPTARSPTGSPPALRAPSTVTPMPMPRRSSMNFMRVGLMPAFRMRNRDLETRPAATSQKLAALRSPGISMSRGERRSAGETLTCRPSAPTDAPIASSISSV